MNRRGFLKFLSAAPVAIAAPARAETFYVRKTGFSTAGVWMNVPAVRFIKVAEPSFGSPIPPRMLMNLAWGREGKQC